VFIDEIDQSQLPAVPTEVGPVVIGRARKGPADKPVQVESFSDFVQTFGNPVAGNEGGDIWREGNNTAPTYAAYAAKAWLRNNSPLTFLRVLGDEKSGVADAGKAGWEVNDADSNDDGGVFALVLWPSASVTSGTTLVSGAVAAQFYTNGRVLLSGSTTTGKNGSTLYEVSTDDDFKLVFVSGSTDEELKVSLDPSSPNFIRKALNTNPTITNSAITAASTRTYYQGGFYWLGESFEYSASLLNILHNILALQVLDCWPVVTIQNIMPPSFQWP
jgi:hypothetical protein